MAIDTDDAEKLESVDRPDVRVRRSLIDGVVFLATPDRLQRRLAPLTWHESAHEFAITGVVNPTAWPAETDRYEWATSMGLAHPRLRVGRDRGTDPRRFPLNDVDKDYNIHPRAYGFTIAAGPGTLLLHEGSRSAPSAYRMFPGPWSRVVRPAMGFGRGGALRTRRTRGTA